MIGRLCQSILIWAAGLFDTICSNNILEQAAFEIGVALIFI